MSPRSFASPTSSPSSGLPYLDDQQVFQALLKVSGIGPTAAMAIIRELGAAELVRVVEAEDVKAFKPVAGVGPAPAKKLISTIKLPCRRHCCGRTQLLPCMKTLVRNTARAGLPTGTG